MKLPIKRSSFTEGQKYLKKIKNRLTKILNSVKVAAHTETVKQIMRTKTLLLTAALTVATAATSMADVFSVNVVGYVNKTVPADKYAILSVPLNFTGEGGNNITNVVTGNIPDGTVLLTFSNGVFDDPETYFAGFGWFPGTAVLPPGKAFFVKPPAGSQADITFVGEVLQGETVNSLASGYTLTGSTVPQALPLGDLTTPEDTTLHFPAADGDNYLAFDVATQTYKDPVTYFGGYGWFDSAAGGPGPVTGPIVGVAEGFFVTKTAPVDWVRTFNVQ